MAKVLIVEDEPELAALLKDYLEAEQFSVDVVSEGFSAPEKIKQLEPDFIILDVMLPGKDGFTICKEVREFSDVPIMMATARIEEIDRLLGLDCGADDYICKPYSPKEVVARVKAILRRVQAKQPKLITGLEVNPQAFIVKLDGQDAELTAIEFKLFHMLYEKVGVIFSREQIMNGIYDDHRVVSGRTIDSHVKKIRRKLLAAAPERDIIHSVYGVGYKLEDV